MRKPDLLHVIKKDEDHCDQCISYSISDKYI